MADYHLEGNCETGAVRTLTVVSAIPNGEVEVEILTGEATLAGPVIDDKGRFVYTLTQLSDAPLHLSVVDCPPTQ